MKVTSDPNPNSNIIAKNKKLKKGAAFPVKLKPSG